MIYKMKKTYNQIIQPLLFLVIMISAMTSIAQTSKEIEGTWNMDYEAMIIESNFASNFNYSQLSNAAKQNMREAYESRTFTFNSDQTVVISFSARGNSKQANGSWNYADQNNILSIEVNGETITYQTSLQSNNLRLEAIGLKPHAAFKSLILTKK